MIDGWQYREGEGIARHSQGRVQPEGDGWEPVMPGDSPFIDHHQFLGTNDISPLLSVPAAIEFQETHHWDEVRHRCHELLQRARPEIAAVFNALPIAPDSGEWYAQMSAFLLPEGLDGATLKERLYNEYGVEIPVFEWKGRQTLRVSIQGYNSWQDIERLLEGGRRIMETMG